MVELLVLHYPAALKVKDPRSGRHVYDIMRSNIAKRRGKRIELGPDDRAVINALNS